MKHHPKSALDTTLGDLKDAIVDVARSVSAPVPSGEQDLQGPRAADSGEDELPRITVRTGTVPARALDFLSELYPDDDEELKRPYPIDDAGSWEENDDEDAELPDDPSLFDAPLTDRQEAAAFHAEEIEQEFGVASRFDETDDWNEEEEET